MVVVLRKVTLLKQSEAYKKVQKFAKVAGLEIVKEKREKDGSLVLTISEK